MEAVLKLPVDVRELPSFRELRAELSGPGALMAWAVLWLELYYRAQEGRPVGRLEASDRRSVVLAVNSGLERDLGEVVFNLFVQTSLLKADGEGWVCPRFAMLYGGGSGGGARSDAQRGGDMRAYQMRQRKAEGGLLQLSLAVEGKKFVNEAGEPLDMETTKRVTWLVTACDNALFKQERPSILWTEGLVQSALKVVRAHSDEELRFGCELVAKRREHPALCGMVTEKLLPVFRETLGALT